jgi:hypothetical protein
MDLRQNIALALVAAGLLVAAPVASAEPSRKGDLSSAAAFAWDGAGVTGLPVVAITDDDTLLNVTEDGKLTVTLSDADDTAVDLDVLVYKSDAAGEAKGEPIVTGEEGGSDERVSKDVAKGFYLVRVTGWASLEGTYKGKATLAAAAPATTPPGTTPPATPPASTDLLPEAKLGKFPSAKAGKSFVVKGTASDDKGVRSVGVAIVKKAGNKCTQLTSKGTFASLSKCAAPSSFLKAKGTKSWSLKVKGLPKGSYTVFARAIDSAGQKQGGFGAANKKAFKVK